MTQRNRRGLCSAHSLWTMLGCFVVGAVGVGPGASVAWADDDANASETAAARELAVDGLKLAEAGRCSDAIEKLARAEKLHHAPIVLGRLGECQIAEGKVVDGTEALRRLLREPLPANPAPNLLRARERAQAALEGAKGKIATLTISVKGPRDELSVTIDGQMMSKVLLDGDRPTDPGDHLVEASAPGYLKTSRRLTVAPGEKQDVSLELHPDPHAAPRPAAPPPPAATSSAPRSLEPAPTPLPPEGPGGGDSARGGGANHTAAYVAWAAGAALAGVGLGFGVVAMNDVSDLKQSCQNYSCPPSSQGQIDSAKTAGNVSTALVVVGAASLAFGTVLYFTVGSSSQPAIRSRAWLGLGQAGIAGEF